MKKVRDVNYRAIHTKNSWRKASHESIANALGNTRGAKALFNGKAAIDYDKHGQPLYVLVWKEGELKGLVVKSDPNNKNEILTVEIPVHLIIKYELIGAAQFSELEQFFK
ncbi:hypothetical protein [Shewanella sp. AC91-MNA-CIBAN-0169]|uniref:hypothetical protein n=1 Tax=Shewanella sp. AC91-MNA-CIBAN-0169 TaxID=3140466 RepID=UPI00332C5249|tara:strand:- start:3610 stop:3939 length:330 start_codon:yes stop_codon:yes gene_type:complete